MKNILLLILLVASLSALGRERPMTFAVATSPEVRFVGRAVEGGDGSLSFDWSGSYFVFRFEGRRCAMRVSDSGKNYYNVFVDGQQSGVVATTGEESTLTLAAGLRRGVHTIRVQKRTEAEQGRTTLYGVAVDGRLLPTPAKPARHIEFIGDSHTCGYGTEGKSVKEPFTPETENCDLAWGCILARYFDADYTLIAHSGQGVVRNWGDPKQESDCTMRDRMLRTFDMDSTQIWGFETYRPDVVVIKLGTNDFSTDISPTQASFNAAYGVLVSRLREKYGEVPILCVAPSDTCILGYLQAFVRARQDAHLTCTAMLSGITDWEGDMGANYHPNHHGQRKMAMAVAPYIATVTGWNLPMTAVK